MVERKDDRDDIAERAHDTPYRPDDFTKLQYVPPTLFQQTWARLKIIGALIGVTVVLAFCGRLAGFI